MSEERALIARAARGEQEAFGSLVAAHRPAVVRVARGILGDEAAADDVAQEAFLRLHESIARFRGDAGLGTWLYRTTLNLCRDRMRATRRRRAVRLADGRTDDALRVWESPDAAVDTERARAAVRRAVERLPPEQREVVVLRFLHDMPYAEIARRTGLPQGTVASRVFRALERLGRELEPKHLEVIK